jgi:hypothetical protein
MKSLSFRPKQSEVEGPVVSLRSLRPFAVQKVFSALSVSSVVKVLSRVPLLKPSVGLSRSKTASLNRPYMLGSFSEII